MSVTSQENETASRISPPLQPKTTNNRSINNQLQALGDSAVTATCQMPSSSLQPVLALDKPVAYRYPVAINSQQQQMRFYLQHPPRSN